MRVVLISNYPPDEQQSMLRFSACLEKELSARGVEADILAPTVRIGRMVRGTKGGLGKWIGYVDKFVLFPPKLRARARQAAKGTVFHICDHSNAMYVRHVKPHRHLVTCHDLLAVRGALGEVDSYCPASITGKVLQRWILGSLSGAEAVVCVSKATESDFRRLLPSFRGRLSIRLMGLNTAYRHISPEVAWTRLADLALQSSVPFVLMVGGNHARKNREGALRIFEKMSSRFGGILVVAGQRLTPAHECAVAALGLKGRVCELGAVTDDQLEALYSVAHALLFPSKAEGFGWPVLEAQACGCPVVCSDRTSIPEVAGEGAFVHALDDEAGFAASLLRLRDPEVRAALRKHGFANASGLTTAKMVDDYLALYRSIASDGVREAPSGAAHSPDSKLA